MADVEDSPGQPPISKGFFLRAADWAKDWVRGGHVPRDWAQRAFAINHGDRLGYTVHLWLGVGACFVASFPVTFSEWALLAVVAAALIRSTMTWRLWWPLAAQPAFALAVAWAAWVWLSVLWSVDRHAGVLEAANSRFILLMVGLWPLMARRGLLIGAYAAGFVVGHVTQAAHAVGAGLGIEWLIFRDVGADRITGWWQPVAGGTALCGVLGLHLWALVDGAGRWRAIAGAMAAVTTLGIIGTGTRGAWIAAAVGWCAAIALAARRATRGRLAFGRLLTVGAAGGLVVGAVAWIAFGDVVESRVRDARRELAEAAEGDFESNIGARLAMWDVASRAFTTHPVQGIGAGAFRQWGREDWTRRHPGASPKVIMGHAHGTPLHVLATTGVVGLALLGAVAASALVAGLRAAPTDDSRRTGYERATGLALGVLGVALLFESIPASTRSSVHFWMLAALSPAWLPRAKDDACESN